ncbi:MAG: hypothetical protein ACYDEP_06620 [Acidimicrobiales bacterium]|nr:hypothetical protein [Actinomycetota bacterium]
MSELKADALDTYRRDARLTPNELWIRYFELGGMSSPLELEATIYGVLATGAHDHDLIAHALNERFLELGGDHPVPYIEGEVDE